MSVVVVTGAAGFLGRTLVGHLVDRGHDVVTVDRHSVAPRPGQLALTVDLLDPTERLDAALGSAGAVIHLAGCPSVRDDRPDIAARRRRDNVVATARVLAGVPAHIPLVVASSSSVYGGSRAGRPSAEGDPLRPQGGYAQSKLLVEQLCARRLANGGVVAMARPFTVVGEHQRSDMALSRWLRDALAGRPLPVFGSLERTRDLTDVRDVARVLAALAEQRACGPVNVGTGRGHRLADLVAAVARGTGRDVRTRVTPATGVEVPDTLADIGRLRSLVGFVPVTDLDAVVARQLAAEPVGSVEVAA